MDIGHGDQVSSWPLVESPFPVLCILVGYFLVIFKLGPNFMKSRQPFDLKLILGLYNLIQVLACAFLIRGILLTEWKTLQFWKCQTVDYQSADPKAAALRQYTYWTFLLKIVELIETVFFVMRKKNSQVTKLHVYHHASTVLLSWLIVRYVGGGMILFSIVLNSFVHMVMYSYYFAALFGSYVQSMLRPIKERITLLQMVQFTFILLQCIIGIYNQCDVPRFLVAIYIPNIMFIFYMFYEFFNQSYRKKSVKDKQQM